jgi:Zn-dependent M28 family amino/carboxypeptidase
LACRGTSECTPTYFQPFSARGVTAKNVAAVIPGADSALRDQYIIVGAHYDHLGRSSRGALDREVGEVLRPGADDNASGSAAVLELARRLAVRPARRSVLVIHFDAEEWGLVGSRVFVEHMPIRRESIVSMLNMDMVGRLRGARLMVDVSSANAVIRVFVDSAAATAGVPTVRSSAIAERSDHASFRRAGIPVVALFTGFHDDYHRATDTAARIDVPGILRVVDVAEAFVRMVGDQDIDGNSRN